MIKRAHITYHGVPNHPSLAGTPRVHIDANDDYGVNYVLDGGYDVDGMEFDLPPTILDVGANIGCATIWFKCRYPHANVIAYEPHMLNAAAFVINTWGFHGIRLVPAGVVGGPVGAGERRVLYEGIAGLHSCGFREEAGERGLGKSSAIMANVVGADTLPAADILKMDTEGCELEILEHYRHVGGLSAVLLEWHSQESRGRLRDILEQSGFAILSDKPTCAIRGDMIAVRPSGLKYRTDLTDVMRAATGPRTGEFR